MSLSSHSNNKRNLFELKHNQNRYAQLVEAQSPEPNEQQQQQQQLQQKQQQRQQEEVTEDEHNKCLRVNLRGDISQHSASPPQPPSCGHLHLQQQPPPEAPMKTNEGPPSNHSSDELRGSTGQMSSLFMSTYSNISGLNRSSDGGSTVDVGQVESSSMLKLGNNGTANGGNLSQPNQRRFEVTWRDLSFSYRPSKLASMTNLGRKRATRVLRDLSGRFTSNQLVAVIGPSGCGKTTLLQFLAGNNASQRERLRISGLDEPKVAFIGQGDCLLPGLTARETLLFASRLQNGQVNFDHAAHVQPILEALGLEECADRNVAKLSGGQAKRVTIAQELLYPTNLLVLDEVTSGLDASTSYAIVRLLKRLVSDQTYPMSIIMSIHQPSARLFAIFDRVYVMSRGSCLYEGSCQIELINAHLSRFNLECPKFHNIADYLIEIASDDLPSTTDPADIQEDSPIVQVKEQLIQHHIKRSQQLEHDYLYDTPAGIEHDDQAMLPLQQHHHHHNHQQDDECQRLNMQPPSSTSSSLYEAVERSRAKRQRPVTRLIGVHLSRSLLRIRRSYILTYLQLVTYILLGLQLATFYGTDIGQLSGCPNLPVSFVAFVLSSGDSDVETASLEMRRIQENMNFLLVAIMTATFAALEITVITFPLEAKTIKREWRNGWYRVSSYFLGRTLADLPFQLLFVLVFSLIIYTLTGQVGLASWRFVSFVTIMVLTALTAQSVGFIFGAIFMDNLPAAVFTAPLCIFPALLFSGFFSRVSQIPTFYKPMTYLSHFRYAFDALLVSLYGFDRCQCDQAALTSYHEGVNNQTSSIRLMFTSLFGGGTDCVNGLTSNPNENSIEDAATTQSPTFAEPFAASSMLNNNNLSSTTTADSIAKLATSQTMKPLEDALVDSVFEHMANSSAPVAEGGVMDHLANRFSQRVTTMLNSRSNFGHQVPSQCEQFNSYLITEFDLHNEDLIYGLVMLFIVVIVSRLICNAILSFTIATRAR